MLQSAGGTRRIVGGCFGFPFTTGQCFTDEGPELRMKHVHSPYALS